MRKKQDKIASDSTLIEKENIKVAITKDSIPEVSEILDIKKKKTFPKNKKTKEIVNNKDISEIVIPQSVKTENIVEVLQNNDFSDTNIKEIKHGKFNKFNKTKKKNLQGSNQIDVKIEPSLEIKSNPEILSSKVKEVKILTTNKNIEVAQPIEINELGNSEIQKEKKSGRFNKFNKNKKKNLQFPNHIDEKIEPSLDIKSNPEILSSKVKEVKILTINKNIELAQPIEINELGNSEIQKEKKSGRFNKFNKNKKKDLQVPDQINEKIEPSLEIKSNPEILSIDVKKENNEALVDNIEITQLNEKNDLNNSEVQKEKKSGRFNKFNKNKKKNLQATNIVEEKIESELKDEQPLIKSTILIKKNKEEIPLQEKIIEDVILESKNIEPEILVTPEVIKITVIKKKDRVADITGQSNLVDSNKIISINGKKEVSQNENKNEHLNNNPIPSQIELESSEIIENSEPIIEKSNNFKNKNKFKKNKNPNKNPNVKPELTNVDSNSVENNLIVEEIKTNIKKDDLKDNNIQSIEKVDILKPKTELKQNPNKPVNKNNVKLPPTKQPKPKIPTITTYDLAENQNIKVLFNKIMQFLEKDLSVLHGSKILLGISGGIDSIVLLDIFYNIAKKYSFKLNVMHFNHMLRGKESDDDQKFVENLCNKYLIPFISASGNVNEYAIKNGMSIEHAARELRYEFFQRKAQSLSANFIATAHHSNDNAETFLLNLFRGSGLTGLTGIPYKREILKNSYLIRPLIKLSKDEIKDYAAFRKLEWRDDSSNNFSNYRRNKIRLNLITEIEKEYCSNFTEIISRTTEILKTADSFIQEHLDYLLKFIQKEKKGSKLKIKLNGLVNNSTFIQGELLQKILTESYKIQNLPSNAIQRIISLFEAEVGTQIDVVNNIIAVRDRFEIAFGKGKDVLSVDKSITKIGSFKINDVTIKLDEVQKNQLKIGTNPNVEFFDYDLVEEVLHIRNWENGDFFHPIGMQAIVKLSDFLTNKKISVLEKKNIIVLLSGNEIIWVIKQRISENFKITDNTKRYLRIEII